MIQGAIPEFGHYALVLALALALVQATVPLWGARIRLGGLVKPGTLVRGDNLKVRFEVTDGNKSVLVNYTGILPDLFREGQGIVTEGALEAAGTFRADSVLAKHDETYMPKEVADALKKQGHWKDDYGENAKKSGEGAKPMQGASR